MALVRTFLCVALPLFFEVSCLPERNEDTRLSFFAVGDFGGTDLFPFYTYTQKRVAQTMGKLADLGNISMILGLGDNFYYDGVQTVDDPRFKTTFEDVYTAPALERAKWLMIAGNHDYRSNISAQIAYTKKSHRWHFPYYYFTTVKKIPNTDMTVQIVMIDTMLLCNDGENYGFPSASEQLKWIVKTLEDSNADYLIVGGHHPIFSAGFHGNSDCLLSSLKPLLEKYDVTAYISGHDHNLQHIKEEDSSVHYFISGGGNFFVHAPMSYSTLPKNSLKLFYGLTGGFTAFDATPSSLKVTKISHIGKELYTTEIKLKKERQRRGVTLATRKRARRSFLGKRLRMLRGKKGATTIKSFIGQSPRKRTRKNQKQRK
ncbi:tartrate-resistant acid phosphatase type 5-like [Actinia tenebrosa]|uniref:Tartrate-resistant acid phosphatase type 5 n=1 Tax=Actinia tenebrosa TaxID=6105 RepID=A0A6P8HSB1_ACTTE|nr:tartrate-resistant acid phosphatase type 5-like [Actinia tenebrosa]